MTQTVTYRDYVNNPDAADGQNIVSRGFRAYFRPYSAGTRNLAAKFDFLGATKGYEPNTDETTREFAANLYGTEETLKRQLASRTRTFNFFTGSTGDEAVTALFYGSAAVTGTGDYANVKALEDTGAATTGDAILVFEPSEGTGVIGYYPSVSLRGTGKGDEDGFETYEFEATIQSAGAFTPPATLINVGKTTPQGVLYVVPKDEMDDFLMDLMDAVMTTPGDPTTDA